MSNDPLKHFLKKGDTEPPLRRQIIQASTGLPYDLTGATARVIMRATVGGAAIVDRAATIEAPASSGVVRWDPQTGETATAGNFPLEFEITLLSGKIITFPPGEFEPGKSYIYVKITEDFG